MDESFIYLSVGLRGINHRSPDNGGSALCVGSYGPEPTFFIYKYFLSTSIFHLSQLSPFAYFSNIINLLVMLAVAKVEGLFRRFLQRNPHCIYDFDSRDVAFPSRHHRREDKPQTASATELKPFAARLVNICNK